MGIPFPYNSAQQIIGAAANIKTGSNPSYTYADFIAFYPQFTDVIDPVIVEQFISMANVTVLKDRWHESWQFGMALFIAHFSTLYLQAQTGDNPTAAQVVAAAQARGLQTSKSVGDVSVSYDFSHIVNDLSGWAYWKSTSYGVQFATMARMFAKAGSYIW